MNPKYVTCIECLDEGKKALSEGERANALAKNTQRIKSLVEGSTML